MKENKMIIILTQFQGLGHCIMVNVIFGMQSSKLGREAQEVEQYSDKTVIDPILQVNQWNKTQMLVESRTTVIQHEIKKLLNSLTLRYLQKKCNAFHCRINQFNKLVEPLKLDTSQNISIIIHLEVHAQIFHEVAMVDRLLQTSLKTRILSLSI